MSAPAAAAVTPERLLHRLDLNVVRRLDGLFQGDYRTLFFGSGVDFADLRDYQPHDDVRHIDWNVTARMDRPFVREYVEDRELTAWLVLDRSPSMTFASGSLSKAMAVTELVTTLARLLTRSGNRIGASLFDHRVERVIEARAGRNQVLRIAHELLKPVQGSGRPTALGPVLAATAQSLSRRSLVVVVSDFITSPGWEQALHLLGRRHEVLALRVVDPHEFELPEAGVVVLEDLESGEQLTVDTGDPGFRSRYATAVAQQAVALRASALRAGVDLHPIGTDEDLVSALVRLAERRGRAIR